MLRRRKEKLVNEKCRHGPMNWTVTCKNYDCKKKFESKPLSFFWGVGGGGLLRWVGLWFFITTHPISGRKKIIPTYMCSGKRHLLSGRYHIPSMSVAMIETRLELKQKKREREGVVRGAETDAVLTSYSITHRFVLIAFRREETREIDTHTQIERRK